MQASMLLAVCGQIEISHAAPGDEDPGGVNAEDHFATMTARFFPVRQQCVWIFYSNSTPRARSLGFHSDLQSPVKFLQILGE